MRRTLFLALALAGCANDPIKPTPIPGNPCGYGWQSCGNHACCPEDSDCGGIPSCPAGTCCYHGATQLYGATKNVRQRSEK